MYADSDCTTLKASEAEQADPKSPFFPLGDLQLPPSTNATGPLNTAPLFPINVTEMVTACPRRRSGLTDISCSETVFFSGEAIQCGIICFINADSTVA